MHVTHRRRPSRAAAGALVTGLLTLTPAMTATATAQDRMPPLPAEQLTPEQQAAVEEFRAARGTDRVGGPFAPLLRSPEMMNRARNVGDYVRYRSALPPRLSEFVILLTARHWTQDYEWYVHAPIAEREGLDRAVIEAVGRRAPAGGPRGRRGGGLRLLHGAAAHPPRQRPDLRPHGVAPGREGGHRRDRHPGLLPVAGDGDEHGADRAPGRGGAGAAGVSALKQRRRLLDTRRTAAAGRRSGAFAPLRGTRPDSGNVTHGLALARRPGARPAPRPPGIAAQSRLRGHRGARPRVGHRREQRHVRHRPRRPAAAAAVPGRRRDRARRRVFRSGRRVGPASVEPLAAAAAGERQVVRAARRLPGDLRRLGRCGRCHPARRQGLAVAVPAVAGSAPPGAALSGGRSADGRGARRAAEPRRLDEPPRLGTGRRRNHDRPGRRPAPRRRRTGRGGSASRLRTANSGRRTSFRRSRRRGRRRRQGNLAIPSSTSCSRRSGGSGRASPRTRRPRKPAPSCSEAATRSARWREGTAGATCAWFHCWRRWSVRTGRRCRC